MSGKKQKEEKNAAASGGRRGLSALLIIVLIAELAVAGFKYPGFLLPKKDPGNITESELSDLSWNQTTEASEYETVSQEPDDEPKEPKSIDSVTMLSEDIPFRYTEEQLAAAPLTTAAVSWEQEDTELGPVQVHMDYWNLETETDELQLKELPLLSAGETGWAIKGYEISLASGQHEFGTNVKLTIPRDKDNMLSGCVWYNEETDTWEDTYAELSEDEASYTIYTDHFSIFGEKSFRFDVGKMALVEGDAALFSVTDGIFVEQPVGEDENRMLSEVTIDYNRMFNLFQTKTAEDVKEMMTLLADEEHLASFNTNGVFNIYKYANYFGENSSELAGGVSAESGILKDATKYLGHEVRVAGPVAILLTVADLTITGIKIIEQVDKGNIGFLSALKIAGTGLWNNKGSIFGALFPVALTLAHVNPLVTAVLGLIYWTGLSLYNQFFSRSWKDVVENPTIEEMYNMYYRDLKGAGYEKVSSAPGELSYQHMFMARPEAMTDEDFTILKETVDGALGKKIHSLQVRTDSDGNLKYLNWDYAVLAILDACADDDSDYVNKVLDQFYFNYADAFWRMSEKRWKSFVDYYGFKNYPDYTKIDPEQQKRISQVYADELKAATLPIIKKALEKRMTENCKAMKKEADQTLLPLLNCRLIFTVTDSKLKPGQPFQDSSYCKDWTEIEANSRFLAMDVGNRYDSDLLHTPMRFADVKGAVFLPLLPEDTKDPKSKANTNSIENYYPYTDEFLPQTNNQNNTVYECTYYHYLMMGAPEYMVFYDWQKNSSEDNPFHKTYRGDIIIPELYETVTKTYTNRLTGKKRQVSYIKPHVAVEVNIVIPDQEQEYRGADLSVSAPYWINTDLGLVYNSYSGMISSYFREPIRQKFRETPITMSKGGSFLVTISDSFTKNYERNDTDGSLLHTEATVSYSFTLTGSFDKQRGTGTASITGNISVTAGDVYEYAVFDGEAAHVCTYADLPKYNIDYSHFAADEMEVTYYEALGNETIVVFFDWMDEKHPLHVSSNNVNANYTQITFVLVPKMTTP